MSHMPRWIDLRKGHEPGLYVEYDLTFSSNLIVSNARARVEPGKPVVLELDLSSNLRSRGESNSKCDARKLAAALETVKLVQWTDERSIGRLLSRVETCEPPPGRLTLRLVLGNRAGEYEMEFDEGSGATSLFLRPRSARIAAA